MICGVISHVLRYPLTGSPVPTSMHLNPVAIGLDTASGIEETSEVNPMTLSGKQQPWTFALLN